MKENPFDRFCGCSISGLKSSNWIIGPNWLINQDYPDQSWETVVITEILAEINLIAAVEPVVNLSRFSRFNQALTY